MFQLLGKPDCAALILRLMLAGIFICQGGLKILQCEGGISWFLSTAYIIPPYVQALVAWGELVCGIALLLGVLTRVAAIGIIVIMIGAIFMVTWKNPFTSLQTSQGFLVEVGYEYNYAIIAMCATLVILGAGAVSVDHFLWRRKPATVEPNAVGAPAPVS